MDMSEKLKVWLIHHLQLARQAEAAVDLVINQEGDEDRKVSLWKQRLLSNARGDAFQFALDCDGEIALIQNRIEEKEDIVHQSLVRVNNA